MRNMLQYLAGHPSASRRLALLYGAAAIPPLYLAALLLGVPLQEARLLQQPVLSRDDVLIWSMAGVQALIGAAALTFAWGSWRGRHWSAVPVARGALLLLIGAALIGCIRALTG